MSSFAQQVLDGTYESDIADPARVAPITGGAAFAVRVFQLEGDQTLGIGLQSQPILGITVIEVRKTEWPQPEKADVVEILSDVDGSVLKSLTVVDEPMSLDDKRLTWSINCRED